MVPYNRGGKKQPPDLVILYLKVVLYCLVSMLCLASRNKDYYINIIPYPSICQTKTDLFNII